MTVELPPPMDRRERSRGGRGIGTRSAEGRDDHHLAFCDVFEMQGGRIGRLISYLMEAR